MLMRCPIQCLRIEGMLHIPSQKKSPAVAEKIAELINSILSGKLSPKVAKEHGGISRRRTVNMFVPH